MNKKKLLNIIQEYYPNDLNFWEFNDYSDYKLEKIKNKCNQALNGDKRWSDIKNNINKKFQNFLDFSLLFQYKPSFIGSLNIANNDGCHLIIKISVIAPVYAVYFMNDNSDWNKIILRFNPINDLEMEMKDFVIKEIKEKFKGYSEFTEDYFFTPVVNLKKLNILKPRQPYLDECIFGTYMSIYP